ncbi:MAG: hypothetical protein ACFFDY_00730 [Candidatus Thorarchaeota archaeon]
MKKENILAQRSTFLRKNNSRELNIIIDNSYFRDLFLINGPSFITEGISRTDFIINPDDCYMVINVGKKPLEIHYSEDISKHKIIYDPYKYESSQKINLKPDLFQKRYNLPKGYIDTLPKWYSFKFTYKDYNLIFVRPEFGLSIQKHKYRNEIWEVLEGKPIIISGNTVYYYVKKGIRFHNPINTYHTVINPNKEINTFVLLKESWNGNFDEYDITRVFNPNHYG